MIFGAAILKGGIGENQTQGELNQKERINLTHFRFMNSLMPIVRFMEFFICLSAYIGA